MKLNVLELFAGVGGFRLGLEGRNGKSPNSNFKKTFERLVDFKVIYSNQFEPSTKRQHANEVYVKNFGEAGHYPISVESLSAKEFKSRIDVLCGGFPCQDYSVATTLRNSRGLLGKKGVLWWEIERILSEMEVKPSYLILENVDRLLKSPNGQRGRDFAVMIKSLSELGYVVEWKVVDASQWGYPQRRKRTYIVGYHKSISSDYLGLLESVFPHLESVFSDSFGLDGEVKDISDNFGRGDSVSRFKNDGYCSNGTVYTRELKYSNGIKMTLKDVIQPLYEVSSDYLINEVDLEKWKYLKGAKKIVRTTKYGHNYNFSEGSMSFPDTLEKPSRTIITSEGGGTPSRFKHVVFQEGVYRRLTPLELERLNGFPDDWTKSDNVSDSRRSFFMGNALVVGIVEMIGDVISAHHHSLMSR